MNESKINVLANQLHDLKIGVDALRIEVHDLNKEVKTIKKQASPIDLKELKKFSVKTIDQVGGKLERSLQHHLKDFKKQVAFLEKNFAKYEKELEKVREESGSVEDYFKILKNGLNEITEQVVEIGREKANPLIGELKKFEPRIEEMNKRVVMLGMKSKFFEKALTHLEQNFREIGISVKEKADYDSLLEKTKALEKNLLSLTEKNIARVEGMVHSVKKDLEKDIQVLKSQGFPAFADKKIKEFEKLYVSFSDKVEKLNKEYSQGITGLMSHVSGLKSHVIAGKAESKKLRREVSKITGKNHHDDAVEQVDYLERERRGGRRK